MSELVPTFAPKGGSIKFPSAGFYVASGRPGLPTQIAVFEKGVARCAICHRKLRGEPWKFGSIAEEALSHFMTEHKQ